ncbi:MAG: sugar transferase [Candidatus Omnitrophica bacterium]|nr:sugar transferase [Candidatus Omnitrophota bacterium]
MRSVKKIHAFYVFADLVIMSVCFYVPYLLKYNPPFAADRDIYTPYLTEYSFVFLLWAIFLVFFLERKALYSTDRTLSMPKEWMNVFECVFFSGILIGAVIFFSQYKFFSRGVFLTSNMAIFLLLGGWRSIKRLVLRRLILQGRYNINVLVVGAGKTGNMVLSEMRKTPWLGLRTVGFLDDRVAGPVAGTPVLGKIIDLPAVAKRYFVEEIIITIPSEKETVKDLIRYARTHGIGVRLVPNDLDEPLEIYEVNFIGLVPLLTYRMRVPHKSQFFLKRLFDIVVSLCALILLMPVFAIIALLVKLDSKGNVIYRQERVGLKGNIFHLYKFRSMVQGADGLKEDLMDRNEVSDGVIFKMRNDPRVTQFGAFLRKYSLDEFPQLVNVLKGEMSLVGPRPPTRDEVDKYSSNQMKRLSIRPGMTGLSQVRGRSELSFRRWVKWDMWYINNWSFMLDMKILVWTIPAVFRGKGAF